MRDELACRRPGFRSGLQIGMADGQVWSLPVPEARDGGMGGVAAGWDDPTYRAILRSITEAEDAGELFRAELALVIHLLRWNYALGGDDLGELLDDRDAGRPRFDLAEALHGLALAHIGPAGGQALLGPRGDREGRAHGPIRSIFRAAWPLSGRGRGRRPVRSV